MKKNISFLLIIITLLSSAVFSANAEVFDYKSISSDNEWELLGYINEFRLKNGKTPVTMLLGLQDATKTRSNELLSSLSHYRPNGNEWYSVLDEMAIAYDTNSFEIIASNFDDSASFANALFDSPSDTEKLLTDISHIGISYAEGSGKENKSAFCIIAITCEGSKEYSICNADNIHLNYGDAKEKINVDLKSRCDHGYGYFSVINEMINGYDSKNTGTNMLEVKYGDESILFKAVVDYTDSKPGSWYYNAVLNCTDKGYFSGTGNGMFNTGGDMTREMFVTVLGRFANVDTSQYTQSSFTDVPTGQWYSTYVEWAAKHNIVSGDGKGSFNGKKAISRQEICVILCNYINRFDLDIPQRGTASEFADSASIADWAKDAVTYCQTRELLKGDNKNNFMPLKTASRAEVAVVFYNFDNAISY